jgi:hypothetical protein
VSAGDSRLRQSNGAAARRRPVIFRLFYRVFSAVREAWVRDILNARAAEPNFPRAPLLSLAATG